MQGKPVFSPASILKICWPNIPSVGRFLWCGHGYGRSLHLVLSSTQATPSQEPIILLRETRYTRDKAENFSKGEWRNNTKSKTMWKVYKNTNSSCTHILRPLAGASFSFRFPLTFFGPDKPLAMYIHFKACLRKASATLPSLHFGSWTGWRSPATKATYISSTSANKTQYITSKTLLPFHKHMLSRQSLLCYKFRTSMVRRCWNMLRGDCSMLAWLARQQTGIFVLDQTC